MAGTTTTARKPVGAGLAPITINRLDIGGEDEAYQIAADLQKLHDLQTYVDTLADALRARIINQLREEGMDASVGGLRGLIGTSSSAESIANRVVQPLKAMASELDSAARNAHVFRNRVQSLVFDAIREFRLMRRTGTTNGLKVNG